MSSVFAVAPTSPPRRRNAGSVTRASSFLACGHETAWSRLLASRVRAWRSFCPFFFFAFGHGADVAGAYRAWRAEARGVWAGCAAGLTPVCRLVRNGHVRGRRVQRPRSVD